MSNITRDFNKHHFDFYTFNMISYYIPYRSALNFMKINKAARDGLLERKMNYASDYVLLKTNSKLFDELYPNIETLVITSLEDSKDIISKTYCNNIFIKAFDFSIKDMCEIENLLRVNNKRFEILTIKLIYTVFNMDLNDNFEFCERTKQDYYKDLQSNDYIIIFNDESNYNYVTNTISDYHNKLSNESFDVERSKFYYKENTYLLSDDSYSWDDLDDLVNYGNTNKLILTLLKEHTYEELKNMPKYELKDLVFNILN